MSQNMIFILPSENTLDSFEKVLSTKWPITKVNRTDGGIDVQIQEISSDTGHIKYVNIGEMVPVEEVASEYFENECLEMEFRSQLRDHIFYNIIFNDIELFNDFFGFIYSTIINPGNSWIDNGEGSILKVSIAHNLLCADSSWDWDRN